MFTTAQVAAKFGVTDRAIRKLASRHNIGTMLTGRQRVYTDADVSRLAERIGKFGRPKAS